jgi:hypothetical protein
VRERREGGEVRDAIPRNDIGVAMMIEWHGMMNMNNERCTIGSLELFGGRAEH